MEQRHPGLQISEDLHQQRWEWAVQRIAWIFLYALLAGIALGLIGKGPMSNAEVGAPDKGFYMEYQRFLRRHSPDTLRLTVTPSSGLAHVVFDARYAQQIDIKNMSPQPARVVIDDDAMDFVFHAVADKPVHIAFDIQPEDTGALHGWVGMKGQTRYPFSQFVYP
jgi:hypothetical protein